NVVELEQVLIQEARWAGDRHDVARADGLGVASGPVELAVPLLPRHSILGRLRELVHHGKPDGAGELKEVDVDRPEAPNSAGVWWTRVIHVIDPGGAIVDGEGRVPKRPVRRSDQALDHDPDRVQVERHALKAATDRW